MDPILQYLADNDLYKNSMGHAVFNQLPLAANHVIRLTEIDFGFCFLPLVKLSDAKGKGLGDPDDIAEARHMLRNDRCDLHAGPCRPGFLFTVEESGSGRPGV